MFKYHALNWNIVTQITACNKELLSLEIVYRPLDNV